MDSGMFNGFFEGLLTIFIVGVLTFGTVGFFIGKKVGYNKAVKEFAMGKIQLKKEVKIDSTYKLIRK